MGVFSGGAVEACEEYVACELTRGAFSIPSVVPATCIPSLESRPCLTGYDEGGYAWGPGCGVPDLEEKLAPPPDAPGVGDACLWGLSERAVCQSGTYCALEDGLTDFGSAYCGVCEAEILIGQACDEATRCEGGARCIGQTCRELLPPGAPCTANEECRYWQCEAGICAQPSWLIEPYAEVLNRPCSGFDPCGNQEALHCEGGRCVPLPDLGQECTVVCRAGQRCVQGRCVAVGCSIDVGEPCTDWCNGAVCVDHTCRSPKTPGVCDDCGDRILCEIAGCMPPRDRSNGVACDYGGDCSSGFCDRDVSEYCDAGSCSIPTCDKCGTCTDPPPASACE